MHARRLRQTERHVRNVLAINCAISILAEKEKNYCARGARANSEPADDDACDEGAFRGWAG